jgi:predicted metal-binding protein
MRKHLMATLKLDGEERVWKRFADYAIHSDLRLIDSALSASRLGRHHSRAVPRGSCHRGETCRGSKAAPMQCFATGQEYRLADASAMGVLWL